MGVADLGKGVWEVFEYEVMMFRDTLKYKPQINFSDKEIQRVIQNALTESLILHTRILIEILISKGGSPDDITLYKLLPAFDSGKIAVLKKAYGISTQENTPCWRFNKLLAHATSERSTSHDYSDDIVQLTPIIESILKEVYEFKRSIT